MNLHFVLKGVVAIVSWFSFIAEAASADETGDTSKKKTNIVLLLTDDQDLILSGIDKMPLLNKLLVEKGTTFTNAFVHTPICCPSRTSILSGRYVHNGGATQNHFSTNCYGPTWVNETELQTFAVVAKAAGYQTSYSGKYLNRYGEPGAPGCEDYDADSACLSVPPGWDKWLGMAKHKNFYYNTTVVKSDDGGATAYQHNHGAVYEDDYFPDVVTNRTLAVIEEFTSTPGHAPFLAVNAWGTPHGPNTPAPWAEDYFLDTQAPRTPSYNTGDESCTGKHWLVQQHTPFDEPKGRNMDKRFARRLESLLSVDEHISRIVELLEQKGELENTIIIYTSDNGFHFGQHRLRTGKRHLYETDIRVPFVVTGPGVVPKNATDDRIVLNIDVAPTIHHIVTGSPEPPSFMDGLSIFPFLTSSQVAQESRTTVTPSAREDFLVSYKGWGPPKCNLTPAKLCPAPDPNDWWADDSSNNTYHCIRTIKKSMNADVDTMYCRFEDNVDFVEYYNLVEDPWQLENRVSNLSATDRDWFEMRLSQLRSCSGGTCRLVPESIEAPSLNSTDGPTAMPTASLMETNLPTDSRPMQTGQPSVTSCVLGRDWRRRGLARFAIFSSVLWLVIA